MINKIVSFMEDFFFGLLCVLFGLLEMWPLFFGLSAHSLLVGTMFCKYEVGKNNK